MPSFRVSVPQPIWIFRCRPRIAGIVDATLVGAATWACADERPSLLAALPPEKMAQVLVPSESWRPFPDIEDRTFWDNLPAAARGELIGQGDSRRDEPWTPIPATVFLEFYRTGSN